MMRVTLKVIPGAKCNEWKTEGDSVKVYLNAPAVEGKANEALIKFTAEHYGVKKTQIQITRILQCKIRQASRPGSTD